MWIAKDDVGEHRLEALDMLAMGFFRGRMERKNGWRDALWTFCYDFTEDEGLTMVEQHLWLPPRLHPLRRRPVLLRRRRVQSVERAVERGRLRKFPPNECEVLAQRIEHSTYTMICRRFNPPSRGWKATSRAWSRMSSRGSKERTRQQRQ
jgi:hypothetical protein